MSNIFMFLDYKQFVCAKINSEPSLGRGSIKKIAETLRVHPSLISQILKGAKDFNPEQANEVAAFLGLDDDATEYFLCLVDIERAGTVKLKTFLQNKRDRMIEAANQRNVAAESSLVGASRLNIDRFNSHWIYATICILLQEPRYQSVPAIADCLKLPNTTISEALDTLESLGLITRNLDNSIVGVSAIDAIEYFDKKRFHINLRLKALDRLGSDETKTGSVTLPVALSPKDKDRLTHLIKNFVDQINHSPEKIEPGNLSFVTVDLFEIA